MDLVVTLAIVGLAAAYIGWRTWRTLRPDPDEACGGCASSSWSAVQDLVDEIAELPVRKVP